jgi:YhcH/YjgK/YiaL family protein
MLQDTFDKDIPQSSCPFSAPAIQFLRLKGEKHIMIYVKRQHLNRYKGLYPSLDTAIAYLADADLTQLQPGRNEIDGDAVFVNRLDYETIPFAAAVWEGHARYGDIHVMIHGAEQIGVSDSNALTVTVRNEDSDFIGFDGPVRNWYPMEESDVLIVFPEDAHMVKVQLENSMAVSRAVVKFRL